MVNTTKRQRHGRTADVVAKAVLKAVTTENPSLRHLAGNDAEKWMEKEVSLTKISIK
jgi:hypothetical protein